MRLLPSPIFKPWLQPLVFSGAKDMTRRVVRYPRGYLHEGDRADDDWPILPDTNGDPWRIAPPHGYAGDKWYFREGIRRGCKAGESEAYAYYTLDGAPVLHAAGHYQSWTWRRASLPSIHLPRVNARYFASICSVGVQRLMGLNEDAKRREGVVFDGAFWRGGVHPVNGTLKAFTNAHDAFADLWDSINAARGFGWDTNPLVWVYSWRLCDRDQVAHLLTEAA